MQGNDEGRIKIDILIQYEVIRLQENSSHYGCRHVSAASKDVAIRFIAEIIPIIWIQRY